MTIDKIYSNGNLSVRSYHACKHNEIKTVEELKNYYSKYKTFAKFRNCGKKSSIELIELCNAYPNASIYKDIIANQKTLKSIIQKLNRPQRQVINRFIKIITSNLRVRARNAITSYIGKSLIISDFLIKIFDRDDFQVINLKNIGKAYISELELYIDKIKVFINEVSNIINEKKLINLNNKFLLQSTFSIENIPNEILQSQSIIKLCEFLILKNVFFKPAYNAVFLNTVNVFNSQGKTLGETALLTNYTTEGVRQISQKCFLETSNKLEFLINFEEDIHQNYDIDVAENFIILSDEKTEKINLLHDTNFSKNFLHYIFSIYLSEEFSISGNIEDVLIPKQFNIRNRHNWKNIYLIKKELKENVDIHKICEDINFRLQERINETYKFNFKSYLSRFLLTENFSILGKIKNYCEIIINEEFYLFLDLDDNIVFNRNTIKTAPEFAFEALDKLGKPSKVEDIYLKIVDLFPDIKTDSNKVRASLTRKNGFVPLGRKSVYGLQKWENELDNFKGGTIRSIAKEYLDNSSTPLHISEITKYVLQYRPKTNENNIIQNLKLDKSKIFIFFKKAVIGVSGKEYETSFTILRPIPKRTWEENYKMLTDFIVQYERVPFSIKNEKTLYSWLNTQKHKKNEGELSETQKKLLNEVLIKFPNRNIRNIRNRSKISCNLNDLTKFIETKKRFPIAKYKEEKNLYYFFSRKRKLYQNNELFMEEYDIIGKILNQYPWKPRDKNSLSNRYETLLNFIKENKRLPAAKYKEERSLYYFFSRRKRLYQNNKLFVEEYDIIGKILNQYSSKKLRSKNSLSNRYETLLNFIKENKRLPAAKYKEEKNLYHFFYRKRRLYQNNELFLEEYDIIGKILNQYSSELRVKNSLSNRYGTLLSFIKENKRVPSGKYKEEQNLYQFFYKQRKLYEREALDDELTALFMAIAKEIQNVKHENTRN